MIPTYQEDTPSLLARSHKQVFRATMVPASGSSVALDVKGGTIGWEERRTPRVQADLSIAAPSLDVLRLMDPRTGCRVTCEAGYVRSGGSEDVAEIADLGLRYRTTSRPDDVVGLRAAGDEALVIDASPVFGISVSGSNIPNTIIAQLNAALSPDPSVTVTVQDSTAVALTDVSDRWDAINDLADQIDAQVYDAGLRTFYIEPRPVIASESMMSLRVGPGGLLEDTNADIDRDNWANVVKIRYRWTDASDVEHTVIGTASATGIYDPATAGTKILPIEREVPTNSTQANKAAAAILKRQLSRSRSYRLVAPAAWWLRPGHTVTVTLPTGDEERHLVSSVTFSIDDYTMTVITRLPDFENATGE